MARQGRGNNRPQGQGGRDVAKPQPPQQIVSHTEIQAAMFSGPLPLPEVLDRYGDIIPDGANRIMVMAETQAKHRQSLESYVIQSESVRADRGLYAGTFVALAGLGAAIYLAVNGQGVVGAIIGGADIVSLAAVFIYGTAIRKKERENRVQALTGEDE